MPMSDNARKAFLELQALGATVKDWGEEDGYPNADFVLIWANDYVTEVFADRSGKYIQEEYIDGHFINPFGFRQDVHEILKKYNLVTDWANEGQVCVYDDPEAPGLKHAADYIAHNRKPLSE